MSDDNDTKDQSAERSQCDRRTITVTDYYEACDERDGEIYVVWEDGKLTPARRVKRVLSPARVEQVLGPAGIR